MGMRMGTRAYGEMERGRGQSHGDGVGDGIKYFTMSSSSPQVKPLARMSRVRSPSEVEHFNFKVIKFKDEKKSLTKS
jgi:hypothetical protein